MIRKFGHDVKMFSLVFGNLYIYFAWEGAEFIDSGMRTTIFTGFGILAALGCAVFLLLRKDTGPVELEESGKSAEAKEELIEKTETSKLQTILDSIVESFKLLARVVKLRIRVYPY